MNATEQLAENWLREELGCKSILFQIRGTPDFVTDQGGFEVKTVTSGKVTFHGDQLERLRAARATILIFEKGAIQPKVVKSEDLDEKFIYESDKNSARFIQVIDEAIYKQLQTLAEKRGVTIQELIRAVIIPEWLQVRGMHLYPPESVKK